MAKEEIQAIADKEVRTHGFAGTRRFYFMLFTGLAFADVKQLKKSEVAIELMVN